MNKKAMTAAPSVDLGAIQQELTSATTRLKRAKTAFEKAARELDEATQAHTSSRIKLGNAVNAVRMSTTVNDIHA